MVDSQKVLKLALVGRGYHTPTVMVPARGHATVTTPGGASRRIALQAFDELLLARRTTPGVATLVLRRRGTDYRAMAVDAREFVVTVPRAAIVTSDYAPIDTWMILDVVGSAVEM